MGLQGALVYVASDVAPEDMGDVCTGTGDNENAVAGVREGRVGSARVDCSTHAITAACEAVPRRDEGARGKRGLNR